MQNVHIGPFPPPLGGISIYLYRLSKIDNKSEFIDLKKITGRRKFRFWLLKQVINPKRKNFIYHHNELKIRLSFYFLSLISVHKFSLVLHGSSLFDQYNSVNSLIKFLIRRMLKKAHFIQVVNPNYKKFIKRLGLAPDNIIVKNAFVPPPLEDKDAILASYKKDLIKFLRNRKPVLVANAYAIVFYDDVDVYGLDMCVELTKRLKVIFNNIGFIFAIANEKSNSNYILKIKEKIKELKIEDNFYFLTGQKELWPIFEYADLMIRPTCKDGFGISIAEALYFKCPAIASGVCERPKGTILFKNRDIDELYEKAKRILT